MAILGEKQGKPTPKVAILRIVYVKGGEKS